MLLTKKIMPIGTYNLRTNLGRQKKQFDLPFLSEVAQVTNKMISDGLRIPAPFDHSKEAKPKTQKEYEEFEIKVNEGSSSFNNAGYWTKFWVSMDENNTPSLYGILDVKGNKDDPNSPAYKALHTNEEVSLSITDNFTDGLDRTWTNGIMHAALVNHAVVPGQEPFKEIPEGSTVVNMSMLEPGSDEEGLVEELKTALRELEIVLPGSTNIKTFLRDLLVAVSNRPKSNSGTELEPVPIYMNLMEEEMLTQAQAEALVKTNAVNPATSKPFTMEDLGFKKAPAPTSDSERITLLEASLLAKDKTIASATTVLNAFKKRLETTTKTTLENRINSLVRAGKVTKEWADANLRNRLEYQMSINNDTIEDHPLELLLSALESQVATNTPSSFPVNGVVQPFPEGEGISPDPTDEQIEESLKQLELEGLI